MGRINNVAVSAVLALTLVIPAAIASAADYTWVGAGTSGNTATDPTDPTTLWITSSNWLPDGVPGSSATAYFSFTNAGRVNIQNAPGTSSYVYVDGTTADAAIQLHETGYFSVSSLYVGYDSIGTFLQVGGTTSLNSVTVGSRAGSSGSFLQSGGTNSVSNLNLGVGTGSNGTYSLSSGQLKGTSTVSIGSSGTGTFNQLGGTVTADSVRIASSGSGTYNLSAGRLTASSSITIGSGSGLFTQTGGEASVAGSLTIGNTESSSGKYDLQGGSLTVAAVYLYGTFKSAGGTLNATTFTQSGGTVEGVLENRGTFTYNSGTFAGKLVNLGTATFAADFSAPGGGDNYSTLTVPLGRTLTFGGAGLMNAATLTLSGGTVAGSAVTNDFAGQMSGKGTIAADFTNRGKLTLSGLLTVNGALTNAGSVTVASMQTLSVSGQLANSGTIALSSGSFAGTGSVQNLGGGVLQGSGGVSLPVTNDGGVIRATGGSSSTPAFLTLSDMSGGNINGGELEVDSYNTLSVSTAFVNTGMITLKGVLAVLAGGNVVNTGTIRGQGRIANSVQNSGVIRAEGGALTLSGAGATNAASGRIEAGTGTSILYTQGLATNAGTIALTGATLDLNSRPLTNGAGGMILGWGSLRTGGLTNNGLVAFTDSATSVYGSAVNHGTVTITNNTTTFFGFMDNAGGTIKTTNATARFLGGMSVAGTYTSDPSDNYFMDLTIQPGGLITGGSGDRFFMDAGFANNGTFISAGQLTAGNIVTTGAFTQTGVMTVRPGSSFASSGTTVIDGVQNWNANCRLLVSGGTTTLNSDAGGGSSANRNLAVTANDSAVVHFQATQHLAVLNVNDTSTVDLPAGGGKVLVVNALTMEQGEGAFTGRLDLADNRMIVDYLVGASPSAEINAMMRSGFLSGWAGTGIVSSAADNNPSLYAIGTLDQGQPNAFVRTTFGGEPVDVSSVILRYTYLGDANLDGVLNGTDFSIIANGFNMGMSGWQNGDFNYDGLIDGTDFSIIANGFNMGGQVPLGAMLGGEQFGGKVVAVPEPATLALLALGGLGVIGRVFKARRAR